MEATEPDKRAEAFRTAFDSSHRLLFLAERFPPSVGGQERLNLDLTAQFRRRIRTHVLSPGLYIRFNLQKLWFTPYVLIAGLIIGIRHHVTHLHVSSARIAFLGFVLSRLRSVRLTISVHGLDITLKRKTYAYKALVPFALRRYDRIICNSRSTKAICLELGVPEDKCHVAWPGVDPSLNYREHSRSEARTKLESLLGLESECLLENRSVLVTVGRLVPRKGVSWFIEHVFPLLSSDVCYFVIGDGPERSSILDLVDRNGWSDRIRVLGSVDNSTRDLVYDAADVFVMPNVPTPGDREGFGIVNIEAGMHDLPVVASNLEGIRDAVLDGKSGRLVQSRDADAFRRAIEEVLEWDGNNRDLSDLVAATYGIRASADRYAELLEIGGNPLTVEET